MHSQDAAGEPMPLAAQLLLALAQLQSQDAGRAAQPVSLPRLCKHLGQGASVLMRVLSLLGDAEVGGQAGPAWVQTEFLNGQWRVALTPAGHAAIAHWQAPKGPEVSEA